MKHVYFQLPNHDIPITNDIFGNSCNFLGICLEKVSLGGTKKSKYRKNIPGIDRNALGLFTTQYLEKSDKIS